jgi:adenylate cyclase
VIYFFEDYSLDTDRRELRRAADLVAIEPQVFDVLQLLIRDRSRVVSKDDLIAKVWKGRIVSESTLTSRITAVRHAVGDCGEEQRLIRTVSRKGHRFVGEVREHERLPNGSAAKPAPSPEQLDYIGKARPVLALPDRPSIAVLPFHNLSGDPDQECFADGIVEDIITGLSRIRWLFVIARNSSFTYKGRAVDVRQVGRELGVRCVLEGSLRSTGNRIRVAAQLVEAETGKHIWAERYDRNLVDVFEVQDEITEAVTIAIAPAIAEAERQRAMRRLPESLGAWGAYQRGLWHLARGRQDDNALAVKFFQQSIELDSNFAGGYCGLAYAQIHGAIGFQLGTLPEILNSAEALARRAVGLDGADAEARSCLGLTLHLLGDPEGGRAEVERALAISPNLAVAHGILGETLIFSGRAKDGISALERCTRLDPLDPNAFVHLHVRAIGLYLMRDYGAACDAAKRAIRSHPEYPPPYRWLAASLGQLGRVEEAKQALEKAIAIAPTSFDVFVRRRVPWVRTEDHDLMREGLRNAGWEG